MHMNRKHFFNHTDIMWACLTISYLKYFRTRDIHTGFFSMLESLTPNKTNGKKGLRLWIFFITKNKNYVERCKMHLFFVLN